MRTMETKRNETKLRDLVPFAQSTVLYRVQYSVQYCTISCCNSGNTEQITNDPRVSTRLLYRHFCVRANKIAVAVVRRSVDAGVRKV